MKKKSAPPSHKKETFLGTLVKKDGELVLDIRAKNYFRHFLKEYGQDGMEVSVTLELKKPKRSVAQSNFYFLYLGLISLSCRHSVEDLHIWARGKFLSKGITEIFGDKVRKVNSTTKLSKLEFMEYMERIQDATGIPIPDPEPFGLGLTQSEYAKLKTEQIHRYKKLHANIQGI